MTRFVMTVLCWLPALMVVARADNLAIEPGQWKVTTHITMNGAAMPPQTKLRCLKPEQAGDVAKTFGPVSGTVTLAERVQASGAEAVAVSLLFAFANPETERRIEAAFKGLGIPVSASHRILPEFREYERGSTTAVNAYLAPRIESYMGQLEERVAGSTRAGAWR